MARLKAIAVYVPALIFAASISLLIIGFESGPQINHSQQWPLLYRLQDPSLYPDDPFVEVLLKTPTVFYSILATFTTPASFPIVWIILHVLTHLGTISAMMAGAIPLARYNRLAPVFAGLMFCGLSEPLAGGAPLHWPWVSHSSVAAAVALWTLACVINKWWTAAFTLAGVTSCLHPLLGISAWVALAGAAAVRWREGQTSWRFWLSRAALGILLTLYNFAPPLWRSLTTAIDVESWKYWLLQVHIQYDPFSKPWFSDLRFVASVALLWMLSRHWRTLRAVFVAMAVWVVVGWIGTEIIPLGTFVRLQPLRTASLFFPLLIWLSLDAFCSPDWKQSKHPWFHLVLGGLIIHIVYFNSLSQQGGVVLKLHTISYAVLSLVFGLLIYLPKERLAELRRDRLLTHFLRNFLIMVAFGPVLLGFLSTWAQVSPEAYMRIMGGIPLYPPYFYYAELAIVALLLLIIERGWRGAREFLADWHSMPRWLALALVFLMCNVVFQVDKRQFQYGTTFYVPDNNPWIPMTTWVRENTAEDALFIQYRLPEIDHFRSRARRSLLFNGDLLRGLYIEPGFETTIRELMQKLKIDGLPMQGAEQHYRLGPEQLVKTARQLEADYLICPPGFIDELTPVYADALCEVFYIGEDAGE